jgi:hypothetical protein
MAGGAGRGGAAPAVGRAGAATLPCLRWPPGVAARFPLMADGRGAGSKAARGRTVWWKQCARLCR